MSWKASTVGLACVLAMSTAGCGSSGPEATTTTRRSTPPLGLLKTCLHKDGYAVSPESAADVGTAPRRFAFIAVWNVLNPSRIALALTFSRNTDGAEQAAAWTRRENLKVGRGAVIAPVARIGTIDVLWTAKPGVRDMKDVYGCVRQTG